MWTSGILILENLRVLKSYYGQRRVSYEFLKENRNHCWRIVWWLNQLNLILGCSFVRHLIKSPKRTSIKNSYIIEISVKQGKDSTRTLSLVINWVRFSKTLQISTLAFNNGGRVGGKVNWVSSCLSFFLSASTTLMLHIFSLLLPVQLLLLLLWNLVN
jgi:hypothetical protein